MKTLERPGDFAAELGGKERLLFERLLERRGKLVSKLELYRLLRPEGAPLADEATLLQYVSRLRRKLGPSGASLRTVWGLGYRLDV